MIRKSETPNRLSSRGYQSNMESRIEIEQSQIKIIQILKWAILILVLVFLLAVFKGYLESNSSKNHCQIKSSFSDYLTEFQQKVFGSDQQCESDQIIQQPQIQETVSENKNSSWWDFFSFGCSKWKQQINELEHQRFSIQKTVPDLPNHEEIKTNPSKYGITRESIEKIQNEINTKPSEIDLILNDLNSMIPGGLIKKESTAEDFEKITSQLKQNQNENKLLDEDYLFDLKKQLNDLIHSGENHNVAIRYANNFRKQFVPLLKELENCTSKQFEAENKKDSDETVLRAKINEMGDQISHLKEEMGNQKKLSDLERESISRDITAMKDRIQTEEQNANQRLNTISEIDLRKKKVKNMNEELELLQKKIKELNPKIENKETNQQQIDLNIELIRKKLNALDKAIYILEAKLKLAIDNKNIKQLLLNMVDPKGEKAGELKNTMGKKMQEETDLLEKIKEYQADVKKEFDSKSRNSEIVYDKEISNFDGIKEILEKDRNDFNQVMSKYEDFKKLTEEYQIVDQEIESYRLRINKIKGEHANLNQDLKAENTKLKELGNYLTDLRFEKENKQKQFDNLKKIIEDESLIIVEKQTTLSPNSELIEKYKKEKTELEEKLKSLPSQLKIKLIGIEESVQKLLTILKEQNEKLNQILKENNDRHINLNKIKNECAILKVYYKQSLEKVPEAQKKFAFDKDLLKKLRLDILSKLEFIEHL